MNKKWTAAAALLLSAAVLCGCRKGDGTGNGPSMFQQTVPVQTEMRSVNSVSDPQALEVDPTAPTEPPFPIDPAALQEPQQDLILVQILDNTDVSSKHTQTVNCFDKAGRVYRLIDPIDPYGNWLTTVQAELARGCEPVNQLSDAERDTLWYLAQHAAEYAAAETDTEYIGAVTATRWLYTFGNDGKPVLLAKYDDNSAWVKDSNVIAFANWFRFFFHSGFQFGQ